MFCDEVLDLIEPIASGDVPMDRRIDVHVQSCHNCRAALEGARTLDRLLRSRPVPKPPPQFTSRIMARVRRQRWRSEQLLDVSFNLALAAVALLIVAAVWLVLSRSGLASLGNTALDLVGARFVIVAKRVAPSLPLYAGATALVITALAVWWWAERDVTL